MFVKVFFGEKLGQIPCYLLHNHDNCKDRHVRTNLVKFSQTVNTVMFHSVSVQVLLWTSPLPCFLIKWHLAFGCVAYIFLPHAWLTERNDNSTGDLSSSS